MVPREVVEPEEKFVGVQAVVGLRTGLALGVGLHEKAAEVGDGAVDLGGFFGPPGDDGGIERVGGFQAADFNGGAEARGEVNADTVGAEDIREGGEFGEIGRGEELGVDVGGDDAGEAEGGVGAGVVAVARAEFAGEFIPFPEGLAGVAAFDGAVEVVPVVEEAARDFGRAGVRESVCGRWVWKWRRRAKAPERAPMSREAEMTTVSVPRRASV